MDGASLETVWNGWQAVEEYADGQLTRRWTHGRGLDEVVRIEADLDGDGSLEQQYTPLYDSTGNLAVLTGADGKPVERYIYTPYGERRVLVDLTPPEVEQVRVVGGEVWVEVSEAVSGEALQAAVDGGGLTLTDTATGDSLPLAASQPVTEGLQAGQRVVLVPDDPVAVGTQVELVIQPEALVDAFLNVPATDFTLAWIWPAGDTVVFDDTPPWVEQVVVRGGVLEIELSETADLAAAASAIEVDGASLTWTLDSDGYTLIAGAALDPGAHTLQVSTEALDLAGLGLEEAFQLNLPVSAQAPDQLAYSAPDPREVAGSTTGNLLGFQGLGEDPESGLLYVRNRYLDPEMGRFVTADRFGYSDAPSLYQAFSNSPFNNSDPMGDRVRFRSTGANAVSQDEIDRVLKELEAFTGIGFSVNASTGDLEMAGAGGSLVAHLLLEPILSSQTIYWVESHNKSGVKFGQHQGGVIRLDLWDFQWINYVRVDPRTYGVGSVLVHELLHAHYGLKDNQPLTQIGDVVFYINLIRAERGLALRWFLYAPASAGTPTNGIWFISLQDAISAGTRAPDIAKWRTKVLFHGGFIDSDFRNDPAGASRASRRSNRWGRVRGEPGDSVGGLDAVLTLGALADKAHVESRGLLYWLMWVLQSGGLPPL